MQSRGSPLEGARYHKSGLEAVSGDSPNFLVPGVSRAAPQCRFVCNWYSLDSRPGCSGRDQVRRALPAVPLLEGVSGFRAQHTGCLLLLEVRDQCQGSISTATREGVVLRNYRNAQCTRGSLNPPLPASLSQTTSTHVFDSMLLSPGYQKKHRD